MSDEKPLTKSALVAALKEAGMPTREDVRQIVGDEVHKQLSEAHAGLTKPALDELRQEIRDRLNQITDMVSQLESEVAKLRVTVNGLKDDVKGLTAELSDKPSRRQFNQLKARVDKYIPKTLS